MVGHAAVFYDKSNYNIVKYKYPYFMLVYSFIKSMRHFLCGGIVNLINFCSNISSFLLKK